MNRKFGKERTAFPLIELLVIVAIHGILSFSTSAQGTVTFYNRGLSDAVSVYNAPVTLRNGAGAGPEFTSGLFLVTPGGPVLLATSLFRSGGAAGYFSPLLIRVPGVPAGASATFRVRVWETVAGSYENAIAAGLCAGEFPTTSGNNEITVPQLTSDNFPGALTPPNVDGILPFTLPCIPEPSTLSLLLAMGLALVTRVKRAS